MRSKLLNITIRNLGCIGSEGLTVSLDNILCLVGNNNSGKSTVLRAYELAVGTESYSISRDKPKFSEGDTEIELSVHIPPGVGNIAEKWKLVQGEYYVVKSKWTWDESGKSTRETFDPEIGDYAPDGNAAGLDNVFKSRLPKPFRVGALDSPENELKKLLQLVVSPIAEVLKTKITEADSLLNKSLQDFNKEALKPVEAEAEKIERHSEQISKNHGSIFPDLKIDLKIGMSEFKFDPLKNLTDGSTLNIKEFDHIVDWNQQGTGSQRALFWSLLQVRSKLQSLSDLQNEKDLKVKKLTNEITKLQKDKDKVKTLLTKQEKQAKIDELIFQLEALNNRTIDDLAGDNSGEITLPGFMLLIDEPEIALHPNGIRAASKYLYELAKDESWQIMLTTHSPLFINPFEDNTTIVRLTRSTGNPSPLTYRSDSIEYSTEEKDQLTLLNTFDQNLAEMFFGQHPIIVEGDTEFASFHRIMDLNLNKYPISTRPIIIRARGKFTIQPIMKMLNHFKVDFSILHDSDYPKTKNGGGNPVWTGNINIENDIVKYRGEGRKIVHRISISTFEIEHLGVYKDEEGNIILPSSKGKPFEMYDKIGKDEKLKESIEKQFDELINVDSIQEPFESNSNNELSAVFSNWVKENEIQDIRFQLLN